MKDVSDELVLSRVQDEAVQSTSQHTPHEAEQIFVVDHSIQKISFIDTSIESRLVCRLPLRCT